MNSWRNRLNMRAILMGTLALFLLHLVLIQPNHPAAMAWNAVLLFPLELPAIVFGLIALGRSRAGLILRVLVILILSVIAVLKTADYVMFTSLSRGFNVVADLPLVGSFYDLIVGTMGQFAAISAVLAALLIVVLLIVGLWWATGYWTRLARPKSVASASTIAALICVAVSVADIGTRMGRWDTGFPYPGTAFTARVGVERVQTARATLRDLRAFQEAAQNDPFAGQTGLFDLVDRDVLVVFVESYGRTSLDTPLYADLHRATLTAAQSQLEGLGLGMSSTLLVSPTQGGQSWLAHASFANGLWVSGQTSYRAALRSERQTLFHLAQEAGFRTAAVMPQITLDWPEAQFMGFDTVLAADDLGYAGLPFNWITMPDQFTFGAMDRLLRTERPDGKPLFIQMALGSSHAPWVPVPDLIAWDDLGDGSVFNPIVEASDPPHIVWQDNDRVRDQYRLAVDYALQTVFAYAALHAEDPPLMIIIGDHQAAGFIALDERPHVPMHIVGPPDLVDRLSDAAFVPGLIPDATDAPRRMDLMRGHILRALSSQMLAEVAE
ncbi:sulfatase-like hydrolase/transferase [Yoonia sp. BS5-3]|uniref:Sulfatase-like hydrolase/transferase n=1 Tax=Yoonia phaeophyticola TaxID=3137369 RepID=A0ABZ2V989_9RHOB